MTNFSTQEAGSSESEVSLAYTASSTTARGQGNKKGDLVLKKKNTKIIQQQKIIKASIIRKRKNWLKQMHWKIHSWIIKCSVKTELEPSSSN